MPEEEMKCVEHRQKIDFAIGGQAVIEGVMMKSPSYITVAVRKKDGSIKMMERKFISFTKRYKALALPLVRGIVNLLEMIVMGMKAINFSADEFADDDTSLEAKRPGDASGATGNAVDGIKKEEEQPGKLFEIAAMVVSLIISLAIAIFLFKVVPLAITEWLRAQFSVIADYYIIFNLIDGIIRIAIFVLYIYVLSLFKTFHRVFEYHGAEHMAVHAYEKNKELTTENVRPENPEHPRCGTSFLLAVFIVSIIIYSIVPRNPVFLFNLAQRIAIIPLIAAVGYEILKWSAKHAKHPIVKLVTVPGLLTQKITTQKPDDKQIEVANAALKRALELERAL